VRKDICPQSGLLPTDLCPGRMEEVYILGSEPRQYCTLRHDLQPGPNRASPDLGPTLAPPQSLKVLFPQEGDIFKLDPVLRPHYQSIRFRASVPPDLGISSVEWWVNGQKVGSSGLPYTFPWALKKGAWTIKATARGKEKVLESATVKILVLS